MGRNFPFAGGTPLLTQTYRPADEVKVQAVIEFAIVGLVAATTHSSGRCRPAGAMTASPGWP
ncbi:hypothetical protein [Stutzerimonas stutzeri]|uniref:hypothetical protein n=1 Tax=Stutzerimonas stutzeri TaxID=316 RepID=UPI002231AAEE|nr:hypothetical protein [Stutzerimonas stutzeri]